MVLLIMLVLALLLASIWGIFSLVIIGHLVRYRSTEPGTWLAIVMYLVIATAIIGITYILFNQTSWQEFLPYV